MRRPVGGTKQTSTSIKIEEKKLKTFPIETLKTLSKGEINKIQTLALPKNLIAALPSDFDQLFTSLSNLDLSYNKLSATSLEPLSKLHLTNLTLTGNSFTNFNFPMLSDLHQLELALCEIFSLPSSFPAATPNIKELNLCRNFISSLPPEVDQWKHLAIIDLRFNSLETVPTSLCTITSIQYLLLDHNKITDLPEPIGELSNLVRFSASNNKISSLPASFSKLAKLRQLILSSNQLANIDHTLFQKINKLKELNLSHNKLTSAVTKHFGGLIALTDLNLAQNHIDKLEFEEWEEGGGEKIKKIDISFNNFKEVPAALLNLAEVEEINLSNNHLSSLPGDIMNWDELKKLLVGDNQLTSLPEELKYLNQVEELFLSGNKLESVDDVEMGSMFNLKTLYLSRNRLKTFPKFLENSFSLLSLERVDLSFNPIAALPDGFEDLSKKVAVDLSFTSVSKQLPVPPTQTNIKIGHSEMQGRREEMEDCICIHEVKHGERKLLLVGLFDGHGGKQAASYIAEHYPKILIEKLTSSLPTARPIYEEAKDSKEKVERRATTGKSDHRRSSRNEGDDHKVDKEKKSDKDKHDKDDKDKSKDKKEKEREREKSDKDKSRDQRKTDDTRRSSMLRRTASGNTTSSASVSTSKASSKASSSQSTTLDTSLEDVKTAVKERRRSSIMTKSVVSSSSSASPSTSKKPSSSSSSSSSSAASSTTSTSTSTSSLSPVANSSLSLLPGVSASTLPSITTSSSTSSLSSSLHQQVQEALVTSTTQLLAQMKTQKSFGGSSGSETSNSSPTLPANSSITFAFVSAQENDVSSSLLSSSSFMSSSTRYSSDQKVGATFLFLLVVDDTWLYSINIGDSRSVLYLKEKGAMRISYDHKPHNAEEIKRIKSLDGYVDLEGRVNGNLAVSRSVGDFYMTPFISGEPYTHSPVNIMGKKGHVVMACDGVWDVIEDEVATQVVSKFLSDSSSSSSSSTSIMSKAATKLRDMAYQLGSDDNISVVALSFGL